MEIQKNNVINNKLKDIDDILVYSSLETQNTGDVMQIPLIGVEDRAMAAYTIGYKFAKEGNKTPALLVRTKSHAQFVLAVAYSPDLSFAVSHLIIERNEKGEIIWDHSKIKYYMPKLETVAVPILYMRMFLDGYDAQKKEVDSNK
jgi:hypothetical protein